MNPQSNILRKIPFLRYTLALIAGVLCGERINLFPNGLIIQGIIIALLIVFFFLLKKQSYKFSGTKGFLLALVFYSFGWIYSNLFFQFRFDQNMIEKSQYVGTILKKSPTSKGKYKYHIQLNASIDSVLHPLHETILLINGVSATNDSLFPGQQVKFATQLYEITTQNNPGEFDYKRYMNLDGIRYQAYNKSNISILEENQNLQTKALNLRSKLLTRYSDAGIENDEFAVLAALTLGDKSFLDRELKNSFSSSGAMHVLAVSGLHVGIIYLVLKLLLSKFGKTTTSRITKIIILVGLLWAYAFITGLSPSVLRSCTMFSFIIIGENLKRRTNIYNTLALSSAILIVVNPAIIFKVGFQLSYAAVTSIVYFQPKIAKLFNFKTKLFQWLWGLFSVSLAAQIGTFPLSLFYFHQFPTYFWLSNFLVIPAATIIIYLAILFFSFSFIGLPIHWLSLVLKYTIMGMNNGIAHIEQLPCAVIQNIWIDGFSVITLYILILLLSISMAKRRFYLVQASLMVLIALMVHSIFININIHNQQKIIFYNTYKEPLLSIIDGKNHYYLSIGDSISMQSEQLLQNTTGYYHTKKSKPITLNKDISSPQIIHNHILYKQISLKIENNEIKTLPHSPLNNITWKYEESEIEVKNSENIQIYILKNSKLNKCNLNTNTTTYISFNNSSLIITL